MAKYKPRRRWPVGSTAVVKDKDLIREQLEEKGLDCADVARRINAMFGTPAVPQVVSRQMVSQLKTGAKKRCTPRLAEHIAWALGVSANLLFVMPELRSTSAQIAPPRRVKVPA